MNNLTILMDYLENGHSARRIISATAIKKTPRLDEAIFIVRDIYNRPWYNVKIKISNYFLIRVISSCLGECILNEACELIDQYGRKW